MGEHFQLKEKHRKLRVGLRDEWEVPVNAWWTNQTETKPRSSTRKQFATDCGFAGRQSGKLQRALHATLEEDEWNDSHLVRMATIHGKVRHIDSTLATPLAKSWSGFSTK